MASNKERMTIILESLDGSRIRFDQLAKGLEIAGVRAVAVPQAGRRTKTQQAKILPFARQKA